MTLLQKICWKITRHRISECVGLSPPEYGEIEYSYQCKICGFRFWDYKRHCREIRKAIRKYYKNGGSFD